MIFSAQERIIIHVFPVDFQKADFDRNLHFFMQRTGFRAETKWYRPIGGGKCPAVLVRLPLQFFWGVKTWRLVYF